MLSCVALEIKHCRYARFLAMHAAHPDLLLVPAADIALFWHTHIGMSDQYEVACGRLFGGASSSSAAAGGGAGGGAAAASSSSTSATAADEEPLWRRLLWGPTSPAGGGGGGGQQAAPSAASALAPVTAGSDKSAAATDVKFEHLSSRLTATAAVAAAPPLPPSTQWPAAASSPAASLLFDPDYLALSPDKRAEAYGRTAALYQQMYGEPYNDPDTAWIAPDVPYPLAAPCSPIAPLLRAFDDNPQHAAQTGAVAAAKRLGVRFPAPHAQVQRAGAHALYLAWLAGRRADKVRT